MVGATSSTQIGFVPGALIAEKYRIERKLGEGGMGAVYLAVNQILQQRVVLKILISHGPRHHETIARFLREARVAAKIQHENVTRVLDFGTLADGAPYLVLEYLDGYDLDQRVHNDGPLSIAEMASRVYDALRGLAVIHDAGIVHRDIKPANLFVAQRQGGGDLVKILDFGLAKSDDDDHALTGSADVMGSPIYMSPEQLRSTKHVDARSDIWSMGVVIYELLTGGPPFDGTGLGEIIPAIMGKPPPSICARRPDVPPALEALVLRCLEKDPAARFPSARALAEAIAPFTPGVAPLSEPRLVAAAGLTARIALPPSDARSQPIVLPQPSSLRMLWMVVLAIGLIGAAGITVFVLRSRARSPLPESFPVATVSVAVSLEPPPPPVPPPVEPSATPSASSPAVVVSAPATLVSARNTPHPPAPKTQPPAVVSAVPVAPPAPKPKDFEGQK